MVSYFEDRLKNHAVHNTLAECSEAITNTDLDGLDEAGVAAVARCQHVLKFARTMLKRCDAQLVSQPVLDQINKHISQVQNHWNQFVQNRDWQILTAPCDSLLSSINQLTAKLRPVPKSYQSAVETLREGAEKLLAELRESRDLQLEKSDDFASTLEGLAQAIKQHDGEIERQKTRIDSLITQQQEAFSAKQETRAEKFSEFMATSAQTCQSERDAEREKCHELRVQQEQEGNRTLSELEAHCEHAKEIVGIIGNIGVTGNYQKTANEEAKVANRFRIAALVCFGLMSVGVIAIIIASFWFGNGNWSMLLFRILTAAILAVPGVYCARESTKHRKIEQRNRRMELEMASISPFLEKLNDEEKAKAILEQLAREYFGNQVDDEEGPFINIDARSLPEILKACGTVVKAGK